jgi:hypothetical protein
MDIIEVWQSRARVFKVIFPECGHTFVMNMTFSHTLSPSGRTYSRIVKDIADNIAPAQREEIAAFLTNSAKEAREGERSNGEAKSTVVHRS